MPRIGIVDPEIWSLKNLLKSVVEEDQTHFAVEMLVAVKTSDKNAYQDLLKKLSSITRLNKSVLHSQGVDNLADLFWEHLEILGRELHGKLIVAYHFHGKRPMMGDFLDGLGIPNNQGALETENISEESLTIERLTKALSVIRQKYPIDDVKFYLASLLALDTRYTNIAEIFRMGFDDLFGQVQDGKFSEGQACPPASEIQPESKAEEPDDSIKGIETLRKKVKTLATSFGELSESLLHCAKLLKDPGIPPDPSLVDAISRGISEFHALHDRIKEMALTQEAPNPAEAASLAELRQTIDFLAGLEKNNKKSQVVQDILDRVLSISHKVDPGFAPLMECQQRARELQQRTRESGTDLPEDASDVLTGKSPFNMLLALLEKGDSLSDEQFESFQQTVKESFGQSFFLASTRQRLFIRDKVPAQETAGEELPSPEIVELPPDEKDNEPLLYPTEESVPPNIEERVEEGGEPSPTKQAPPEPPSLAETQVAPEITTEETDKEARQEEGKDLQTRPESDSCEFARGLLAGRDEINSETLIFLCWKLIEEDRPGLAYHLARIIEDNHDTLPKQHIQPWIIRAVALGSVIRHPSGNIGTLLKEDFSHYGDDSFPAGQLDLNHALRLLLASASMRSSLLAPETHAFAVLSSLRFKEGLGEFYKYCQAIAKYGSGQTPLDTYSLEKVKDNVAWEKEYGALIFEGKDWWSRSPKFSIAFFGAARVWMKWLEKGGLVWSLIQPVLQNDSRRIDFLKKEIDRLENDTQIRREVDYTDTKILKHHGAQITAKAYNQLKSHLREVCDLAGRWVSLQESKPGRVKSFAAKKATELSDRIRENQTAVQKEIKSFGQSNRNLLIKAAVATCIRAVKDVGNMFDPGVSLPPLETDPKHILHGELLKIPNLSMDDDWLPENPTYESLVKDILTLVADPSRDWDASFRDHSESRDHAGTDRIIEMLQKSGEKEEVLDNLRQARDKSIAECVAALVREAADVKREIEESVFLGLLTEKDRGDFVTTVERIDREAKDTLAFHKRREELRSIRRQIKVRHNALIELVRRRMENLNLRSDDPARKVIENALSVADVLTANEYISAFATGNPLPEKEAVEDVFAKFFPDRFRDISEFLEPSGGRGERPDFSKIIREIHSYSKGRLRDYNLGPVQMYHVGGKQAEHAANMLESWFAMKKSARASADQIRPLLEGLGFTPLEIRQIRTKGKLARFETVVHAVRDKRLCPVAHYGSQARGRYQLLCTWDRPTEEDLVNGVAELAHSDPVIILYFGRLTEVRRRNLAFRCRERRKTFLVLDDISIIHLCGEKEPRLPSFFRCTLPFTFIEPYTITAGLVPPEMFYGRERERDTIIDPMGSCFIYGGRQLGKTALLRDVERILSEKGDHVIARWVDLKAEGVGYNRAADDVWHIIRQELKDRGVLDKTTDHGTPERLFGHIRAWLDTDSKRRILLLLDEADKFLEADSADEFIRSAKLKGLMDQTNRRFKVVFAGLHNVLRTTRMQNHPLAHYGEPICIGPLLDNGEVREARSLVVQPLASLGYHFESEDMIIRLLSQTNYYPSLIQLYCNQLLKHINEPARNVFDTRSTPPFVITSKHVDDAYRSQQLRKAIRDRFIWTLDLDDRYKVIAFAIALYSGGLGETGHDDFSLGWIREQAMTWWAEGFKTRETEDAFRVLLEEMVGLGILRVSPDGRYSLRSPNLITMIGTREEIESELGRERDKLPEYDSTTFRTAFRSDGITTHSRKNPLTASQENELRDRKNGVSILFGCKAAHIDDLASFMKISFGEDHFVLLDSHVNDSGFHKHMKGLSARERHGTTLILVTSECPWGDHWVKEAANKVRALKSSTSFVRIAFVSDPATAWRLLDHQARPFGDFLHDGINYLTIRPWHNHVVIRWLDESCLDKVRLGNIIETTGNWPFLIDKLHRNMKSAGRTTEDWENAIRSVNDFLSNPINRKEALHTFGIDNMPHINLLSDLHTLREVPITAEELAGLTDSLSLDQVERVLRWGDLVGIISPAGNRRWQLDPIVGKILSTSTTT
jgi:hypothetical protein